jgi:UDP-N-acetylglucosamine acyltransferase
MAADPLVHPTAVIDPQATLASDVRVGAFSVIGPEVTLESEVEIGHHVILEGTVHVGARARIGHGAIIGGLPQDLKFRPGTPTSVRIGNGAVIREYVTIHRATQPDAATTIGSDCLIMASCHIAHDCCLGQGVIMINYAGLTGHCEVGDRATIGGLTGIAPFTRIGTHAYIGGVSKIVSDVPPYLLVDGRPAVARGVNVIGLRRAGMSAADRRVLQDAFRLLYRSGLPIPRALERIREELPATAPVKTLLEFIATAKRGVVAAPADSDAALALEGERERIF